MLIGIFIYLTVAVACAKTIYVPDDYPRIQWAIDNATSGDLIIVRDGVYNESIVIGKSYLTVTSENGSDMCVIHPADINYTILITGSHISLDGLTINGSGLYGIIVDGASSVRIASSVVCNFISGLTARSSYDVELVSNTIRENMAGLSINDTSKVVVRDNEISRNIVGLILTNSSNVHIMENDISENTINLILNNSNNVSIIDNTVMKSLIGIALQRSNFNTIRNCIVRENLVGITLNESSNNVIAENNAVNNTLGIFVSGPSNEISDNVIFSSIVGILLDFSDNEVHENEIKGNFIGISVNSSGNVIYMNDFVANNVHATAMLKNVWNTTSPITYGFRGKTFTNYLGNYWGGYSVKDENGDGVGDKPYKINDMNIDHHPLLDRFKKYKFTVAGWRVYDHNGNRKIDDDELIEAITDWLNSKINDTLLIEIITLWLKS